MAQSWLTPIINEYPITFGAERLATPVAIAELYVKLLSAHYPRSLMSFKAHLLLSDEAEEACGESNTFIDWSSEQDILIDGQLALSHCAESFLNLVPTASDILRHVENMNTTGWDEALLLLHKHICNWLRDGFRVIVIKEGGF